MSAMRTLARYCVKGGLGGASLWELEGRGGRKGRRAGVDLWDGWRGIAGSEVSLDGRCSAAPRDRWGTGTCRCNSAAGIAAMTWAMRCGLAWNLRVRRRPRESPTRPRCASGSALVDAAQGLAVIHVHRSRTHARCPELIDSAAG